MNCGKEMFAYFKLLIFKGNVKVKIVKFIVILWLLKFLIRGGLILEKRCFNGFIFFNSFI